MTIKGARAYDGPSQDALNAAKELTFLDGQADEHKWVIGDDLVAKIGPASADGVKDGSGQGVTSYTSQLNEAAGTEHKPGAIKHWRTTATRWPAEMRDTRKPWTWHHLLNGVPADEKAAALRKVKSTADARRVAKEHREPKPKKTAEDQVIEAMQRLVVKLGKTGGSASPRTVQHLEHLHTALGAMLARAKQGEKS